MFRGGVQRRFDSEDETRIEGLDSRRVSGLRSRGGGRGRGRPDNSSSPPFLPFVHNQI